MKNSKRITLIKPGRAMSSPLFFGLTIVLVLLLIFSCSDESKTIQLKKVREYPAFTSQRSGFGLVPLAQSSGTMFGYLNDDSIEVEIYRLGSTEPLLTIKLDSIAKDFYIYPHYFLPVSVDSVFIFSASYGDTDVKHIFLLNSKGELKETWKMKSLFPSEEPYALQPNRASPVLYRNNKLYFQKILANYNYQTPESRKMAYSEPTELILDISGEGGKVENKLGKHPEEYFEVNYADLFTGRCLGPEGKIVYSYPSLGDLMVFDQNGSVRRFDAHSDYIDIINPRPDGPAPDMAASKKYMFEEPKYGQVYYIPAQQLYVRLANHRNTMYDAQGKAMGFRDQKKSLIVLDSQFNRLGEYLIDMQVFNCILGANEEGILVSEDHDGEFKIVVYEILRE